MKTSLFYFIVVAIIGWNANELTYNAPKFIKAVKDYETTTVKVNGKDLLFSCYSQNDLDQLDKELSGLNLNDDLIFMDIEKDITYPLNKFLCKLKENKKLVYIEKEELNLYIGIKNTEGKTNEYYFQNTPLGNEEYFIPAFINNKLLSKKDKEELLLLTNNF